MTVKGINGAGLATSSSSNGVYLSYLSQGLEPLTPVYLWDADPMAPTDMYEFIYRFLLSWQETNFRGIPPPNFVCDGIYCFCVIICVSIRP